MDIEEFKEFQFMLRMNNIEIAKLLGVSTFAVNGWRSGKDIPVWIEKHIKTLNKMITIQGKDPVKEWVRESVNE